MFLPELTQARSKCAQGIVPLGNRPHGRLCCPLQELRDVDRCTSAKSLEPPWRFCYDLEPRWRLKGPEHDPVRSGVYAEHLLDVGDQGIERMTIDVLGMADACGVTGRVPIAPLQRTFLQVASLISVQRSHRLPSSLLLGLVDVLYGLPLVVLHGLNEVSLRFVEILELSVVSFAHRLHALRRYLCVYIRLGYKCRQDCRKLRKRTMNVIT